MNLRFTALPLRQIRLGEPLPGKIYLMIDFRHIAYRGETDVVDRDLMDRLLEKKVQNVYYREEDQQKFRAWLETDAQETSKLDLGIQRVRDETSRKLGDIFQSKNPDKAVEKMLTASRRLVSEVAKQSYVIRPLAQLQSLSRSTADHSVNVSILATYLGLHLGYSAQRILENISVGALLHDLGRIRIKIEDTDLQEDIDRKLREHPRHGLDILREEKDVPLEVRMIVEQHHEQYLGNGYPNGIRGSHIYELARLVGIANEFDTLVARGQGSILERQTTALLEMTGPMCRQFDPQMLEKISRVLKLGI